MHVFSTMYCTTKIFNCWTSRRNSCTTFCRYVRMLQLIRCQQHSTFAFIVHISIFSIVRLLDTSSTSVNQKLVHKIRLQYFDRRQPDNPIGTRDVTCTVHTFKPCEQNSNDEFNSSMSIASNRLRRGSMRTSVTTSAVSQQDTRTWFFSLFLFWFIDVIFFFFKIISRWSTRDWYSQLSCHYVCIRTDSTERSWQWKYLTNSSTIVSTYDKQFKSDRQLYSW
jgi:hypothetical protein